MGPHGAHGPTDTLTPQLHPFVASQSRFIFLSGNVLGAMMSVNSICVIGGSAELLKAYEGLDSLQRRQPELISCPPLTVNRLASLVMDLCAQEL